MKTLRKVLSVALVLAMAFSLVTLAGAADTKVSKYQDFTDAAEIVNTEAVDTLTALGIINGMGDGSFAPKGNFTRAQAAKIIAYMLLGATSADNLRVTVAPFKDVPATHWAAAYIQYCVTRGIINGQGDGTFNPDGYVTGAQFAKMLLTAIGYGKLGEYVGDNWALNAIVDAQNLGILDTNADYMAPATRDEVARYAFNAFVGDKCYFVVLSKDLDGYIKVTSGANAGTLAQQQKVFSTYDESDTSTWYVFDGLVCRRWHKDGVMLTENWFPIEKQKVLYVGASGTGLKSLSNPASSSFVAQADSSKVEYYLNGKTSSESAVNAAIGMAKLGATLVKLIDTNQDGRYNVVSVMQRQAYEVSAKATVTANGRVTIPGTPIKDVDKKLIDGPVDLDRGDVVVIMKDEQNGKYFVEKCKKIEGQMTKGSATNVVFAGGFYLGSAVPVSPQKSVAEFAGNTNIGSNLNKKAVAYVDNYNYIVSIALDDTVDARQYALVLGYEHNNSEINPAASVRILKQDGTRAVYSQAPNSNGDVPNLTNLSYEVNGTTQIYNILTAKVIAYDILENGQIKITRLDKVDTRTDGQYTEKSSTLNTDDGTFYITQNTVVFYWDGSDAKKANVTTGFAKTVTVNDNESVHIVTGKADDVVAAVLFDVNVTTLTSDYKYAFHLSAMNLNSDNNSGSVRVGNGSTLLVDHTVYDGKETITLTADFDDNVVIKPGLFAYKLNAQGLIDKSTVKQAVYNSDVRAFAPKDADEKGYTANGVDYVNKGYADVTFIDPAGAFFVINNEWDSTNYKWKTRAIMTDENTKFYNVDLDMNHIPFNSIEDGGLNTSSTATGTAGAGDPIPVETGVHYKILGWVVDKDDIATQVYYTYIVD